MNLHDSIADIPDKESRKASFFPLVHPSKSASSAVKFPDPQTVPCALIGLLNEPDRHRVAIKFSIARLDGGNDDADGIQDPKDCQENEADQDQAKDGGDNVVD